MFINQVTFSGRIAAAPEFQKMGTGYRGRMRLAINEKHAGPGGTEVEKTHWITIKTFGKTPEALAKMGLEKGAFVLIHGKIDYSAWEDKTTHQKRDGLEAIAFVVLPVNMPTKGKATTTVAAEEEEGEWSTEIPGAEDSKPAVTPAKQPVNRLNGRASIPTAHDEDDDIAF